MGVDWHTARALIAARSSGVDFDRTATLGRQNLHVSLPEIADMLRDYGLPGDRLDLSAPQPEFADDFFGLLGTRELTAIDASSYEGAHVHDMNLPIPESLRQQFDVVLDGGTLEHVFNFPTAIQNAMEMVRVGGHLFLQTPANNFLGHGFYQFSPELFFRVLSADNGYAIERMLIYETYPGSDWYEVTDPAAVQSRVELIGSEHRTLLLVHARRTADKPIFAQTPQQSDYAASWSEAGDQSRPDRQKSRVQTAPSLARRAAWYLLGLCGPAGRRACQEQRIRFHNRQLGLHAQPGVYKPTAK
jgi:SAM-dependent methyltransferase